MVNIKILNANILSISINELLAKMREGVVFTPNVDHMIKLQHDKDFYQCYQQADWVICDSEIINLAAKFLGTPFTEVIPGSSLFPAFYNYHKEDKTKKIFLLGAAPGVGEKAAKLINQKVGWEMVIGSYSPKFGFEKDPVCLEKINEIINKSGANVLVIGLGAPKQEKWIIQNRPHLPNVGLFMALGATIDFEAGQIKRAPYIYRKMYIEWYYRLLKEPRRLWRRYLIDDLPFFKYIYKQKRNKYQNPFEGA